MTAVRKAIATANYHKANSTIMRLELRGNRIGDDGAVALAHSVKALLVMCVVSSHARDLFFGRFCTQPHDRRAYARDMERSIVEKVSTIKASHDTISNMLRCGTTRQLLHDNQQKTVMKLAKGGLRKHQKTEAHTQSTEHRFSMTQFLKESEG